MNTTIITASLLGLAVLGALIIWAANRPAIQPQAFDAYEACVAEEYGTTPSAFYQTHGSYPECVIR